MFLVGKPPVLAQRLVDLTYEALKIGIKEVKPGAKLGNIGHKIQSFAEKNRCTVVREYCGHGIGRTFHEEPQVLHYGKADTGIELEPGMTFTIEPMINAGESGVTVKPDGWTAVTQDGSLSAHYEH